MQGNLFLAEVTVASATAMPSASFDRIASLCALLAGLGSLVYALAFLVPRNSGVSALVLLLVGLLSASALMAVYLRLREAEAAFALYTPEERVSLSAPIPSGSHRPHGSVHNAVRGAQRWE